MAGDWIKLAHATLDKPEIRKTARMLGIKHGEALELYLRWWVWLDVNCVDSLVDGLVDQDVDDLMRFPGLSACMREVGWLTTDPASGRLFVTGFESNNGESAKKRALRNKNQANWRANVDSDVDRSRSTKRSTKRSTREEKSNTSLRSVLEAPSDEHRALADQLHIDCAAEFLKYRDHFAATGKPHKDQGAGFRNWLKRAADFKSRVVPARTDARTVVAAAIFGDRRGSDDIDGTAERVG